MRNKILLRKPQGKKSRGRKPCTGEDDCKLKVRTREDVAGNSRSVLRTYRHDVITKVKFQLSKNIFGPNCISNLSARFFEIVVNTFTDIWFEVSHLTHSKNSVHTCQETHSFSITKTGHLMLLTKEVSIFLSTIWKTLIDCVGKCSRWKTHSKPRHCAPFVDDKHIRRVSLH